MPIVHAVAHFLAGAACVCHPLMGHTFTQIETAAEEIRKLTSDLRRFEDLDRFSDSLRVAFAMACDEPDQWRIRALRVAMGKLMAIAFPIVLQNPRWLTKYGTEWGLLHMRLVTDHKWLSDTGLVEKNDLILAGFENMGVLWVQYRGPDWKPSDDLMFPEREAENLPVPTSPAPPPSPPPFKVTGGKRKSKAIPIVRPDGTIAIPPSRLTAVCDQGEKKSKPAVIQAGTSSTAEKATLTAYGSIPSSTAIDRSTNAKASAAPSPPPSPPHGTVILDPNTPSENVAAWLNDLWLLPNSVFAAPPFPNPALEPRPGSSSLGGPDLARPSSARGPSTTSGAGSNPESPASQGSQLAPSERSGPKTGSSSDRPDTTTSHHHYHHQSSVTSVASSPRLVLPLTAWLDRP